MMWFRASRKAVDIRGWKVPEVRLAAWGALLNGVWEFLQSPLYTDHARGWIYVLWTRLHCTGGDVLILLGAFWVTSIAFRSRRWWAGPQWGAVGLFLVLGLGYTAWSELYNTQVREAWKYSFAMPRVLGLGAAPLLQWVLLPPVVLALTGRTRSQPTISRIVGDVCQREISPTTLKGGPPC